MSKKSITAASSAQDRARAAEELRAAQAELSQWFEARKADPTTPREIFEGQDYGPYITLSDIEAQGRIIAQQYDYVDYGSGGLTGSTGGTVIVGSSEFFVPGFGSNPDALAIPPTTRIARSSDDAIAPNSTAASPTGGGTAPPGNNTPPGDNKVYGNGAAGSSERFAPAPNGADPAGRAADTIPDPSGSVPSPTGNNSNTTGATAISRNAFDDSGKDIASGGGTDGSDTQNPDRSQTTTAPASEGRPDRSPGGLDAPPNISRNTAATSVGKVGFGNAASNQEANPREVKVRPNVLHDFSNWTYSIALYMLTPKQHNALVESGQVVAGGSESTLSNLIIKSGGTGGRTIMGTKRDYHIENLRFTSVMGQNARTTKSSNNFDISFDIVEPYGVSFLAELVQAAFNKGIEDHLDTAYLLEINFSGYDDQGKPYSSIPGAGPKYIPIKLINIKFKIDSAATIYNVSAVPYAHSPLQDKSEAYVPENIRLEGQTFGQVIDSLAAHLNGSERSKAAEQGRAENSYFAIVHDQELKDSKLAFVKSTDGSGGSTQSQLDRVTFGNNGEESIHIAAGSTIKDAIQAIAMHTDFGAKYNTTGTEASASGNENRPFRLVKVVPVVKLGNYNPNSRLYTKSITYKVETEKHYGMLFNGMPAARAESRGWAKEYNWIFTGKNQDIVDFNAEYNLQYFYIKSNYTEAKSAVTGTPSKVPPGAVEFAFGPTTDPSVGRAAGFNTIQTPSGPQFVQTPAGSKQVRSGGNAQAPAIRPDNGLGSGANVANPHKGPAYQLAADHMDNVLNNPNGDMIVVDLTIIGDPDWIPQDASILPVGNNASTDSIIDSHGSIAIDTYPPLLSLSFKTPRDYDAVFGLMLIGSDQTFVQGKYQVITVTSTFTDGKFEQQLKCVRLQNQDSNDASKLPDQGLEVGYGEGQVDPGLARAAAAATDARVSVSSPPTGE